MPFRSPCRALAQSLCLILSLVQTFGQTEEIPLLEDLIPKWDKSVNIRVYSGYKDNVLLGPKKTEKSPFVAGGLDLMIFRLPVDDTQFYVFATADYVRYTSTDEVDDETLAILQSQLEKQWAPQWSAAGTFQYLFFDQVFDATTVDPAQDPLFGTLQLQAHTISLSPSVRRDFEKDYWLELEFETLRQEFKRPLDDYWEAGPELTFGRKFGHRSEWSISYEFDKVWYDTRTQRTRSGLAIPGSSLEMDQHKFALELRYFFDEKRRWRSLSKLAAERNEDNGEGFFNFWKYQASQQLRYRAPTWEIRAEARITYYDYDRQTVSSQDSSTREKTIVAFGLRGEKQIFKSLKAFSRYEHERSISNIDLDEYNVNTISAGLDWEF